MCYCPLTSDGDGRFRSLMSLIALPGSMCGPVASLKTRIEASFFTYTKPMSLRVVASARL